MAWAMIWSHSFKGPGGQWYIENSLTTIGKDGSVLQQIIDALSIESSSNQIKMIKLE